MVKMKWRIVGFDHPKEEKSLIYKQNLTSEQLLVTVKRGVAKGCNIFSIRGFKEREEIQKIERGNRR